MARESIFPPIPVLGKPHRFASCVVRSYEACYIEGGRTARIRPLPRKRRRLDWKDNELRRSGAEGGTRTRTGFPTRPSNVRVYQFHHFGAAAIIEAPEKSCQSRPYSIESLTSA